MDNRINQDIDVVVDAISAAAREVEDVVSNHNKRQCSRHSSFRYGHSDPSLECANCLESMCMVKTCLDCGKEV